LQPDGREVLVTSNNVDEYIASVIDAVIGKGVQAQAKALREGFSKVFPIKDLATFTVDELVMLFGNSDEDWGEESGKMCFLSVYPGLTLRFSIGRGTQG
jgi:E3 ubiquitin-protein ligase TRIP12